MHADRIAALKVRSLFAYLVIACIGIELNLQDFYMKQREVEKREAFKRQGHGEYREVSEGDFLGEVTRSQKVICHFYHKEFYRCK